MVQAVDPTNSHFKRLFKLIGNTWSYVICPPLGINIELYPDHVFLVTPYVFVIFIGAGLRFSNCGNRASACCGRKVVDS